MKTVSGILITLSALALLTAACRDARAETVRPPVWAGKFYPAQPEALKKVLDDFARLAEASPLNIPRNKHLRAIVLPHAGYIYSGQTAAHVSRVAAPASFDKIIVMAPDHRVGFSNGVISQVDAYQTPLGTIRVHPDAAALRQQHDFFTSSRISDETEHAVEVVLPFLQHFLGSFDLIPIVLGPCRTDQIAESILATLDDRALLVVSSDLSHYLPYEAAVAEDRATIEMILACDADGLSRRENAACGKMPLMVLFHIARLQNWVPVFLHYANSGDTAGSRDRVVGYAAIAFYSDGPMKQEAETSQSLSPDQGRLLVKLARLVIEDSFSAEKEDRAGEFMAAIAQNPEFQQRSGTFVTLQRNHQLRGCIGNLSLDTTILEGVKRNALQAAFQDPRFPPLTREELSEIGIEISILSPPKILAYRSGSDLISLLRVNTDGVIIRKGAAGATFLPQVWQQLPDPRIFLSRLCLKAGFSPDAWEKTRLDVMTYQVQHFDEKN